MCREERQLWKYGGTGGVCECCQRVEKQSRLIEPLLDMCFVVF